MNKFLDPIWKIAKKHANKTCLQIYEKNVWYRIAYSELQTQIEEAAHFLKNAGINKNDRIILLSENRPEAMIAYLSILAIDATAVLIDYNLPKHELKKLIDFVDARMLLISEKFRHDFDIALTPQLPIITVKNGFDLCNDNPDFSLRKSSIINIDPTVATILFTSGTSGHARAVMLTYNNLHSSAEMGKQRIQLTENDRMLSFLPIHHIASLSQNLAGLFAGVTNTFAEKLGGRQLLLQ